MRRGIDERFEPIAAAETAERFSLRNSISIFFRHARTILLVVTLSMMTVGAYLAIATTKYTAVTRVLVGIGREKLQDIGMSTQPMGNLVFQERDQNVNNEIEILRDPALIEQVLPELKARMAQIPPLGDAAGSVGVRAAIKLRVMAFKTWLHLSQQQAVDMLVRAGLMTRTDPDVALAIRLYRGLSIIAVKETDVITISFTWSDPTFAADALNIYLAAYQAQHMRVYETQRSVGFFETQLAKAQVELQAAEAARADFLRSGDLSNFEMQKTQLQNEIETAHADIDAARLDQETTRLKLASIERAYSGGSAWIETAEAADSVAGLQALDQTYVSLLDERTKLVARYQPGAKPVRDVDDEIARLRTQKYQSLGVIYRGRQAGLTEKAARLQSLVGAKEHTLHDLTERNAGYDAIQRRLASATALVAQYRGKLEELQVNNEMNASAFSSIRVLSEATPPPLPSFPKKMLLLALGLGFGLLAGIAYALIAEFVSRVFREPRQVSQVLRLPVLASVPELRAKTWT